MSIKDLHRLPHQHREKHEYGEGHCQSIFCGLLFTNDGSSHAFVFDLLGISVFS